MKKLGPRLRLIRKENNLTQAELGSIFGLTKYSISLYENNKISPGNDFIANVAAHFNISVDWLLGLTDEKLPADQIREDLSKYYTDQNCVFAKLWRQLPSFNQKERSILAAHLNFAMELIKNENIHEPETENNQQ